MADFTIRSDQIDVEQIMGQIRARIKEKRGVDYTEQEIKELASVKLERFLDPRALRSDLLAHYREQRPADLPPPPPTYAFDDEMIYASHRGPLRWIRKVLNPLLKLLFNPNPMIQVLHMQGKINEYQLEQIHRVASRDELNYELVHNLVLEITRLGIEVKNLKMRVESLSTRLDFDERRARSLEGIVQFKPGTPGSTDGPTADEGPDTADGEGDAGRAGKRRRRRRGRRRGPGEGGGTGDQGGGEAGEAPSSRAGDGASESGSGPGDGGPADNSGTDQ